MKRYLKKSKYIDFDDRAVSEKAVFLAGGTSTEEEVVRNCYLFVRDQINVIEVLEKYHDVALVFEHLPDVLLLG
jgi:hypothetical protein